MVALRHQTAHPAARAASATICRNKKESCFELEFDDRNRHRHGALSGVNQRA
jgi:hypothetical protein